MFKILCVIVIIFSFTYGQESLIIPSFDGCIPNKEYKVECNSCLCTPQGKFGACTLAACPHAPEKCSPGQIQFDGCNTCNCANGIWACTDKFCFDGNRRKRHIGLDECKPGDTKTDGCESCFCYTPPHNKYSVWACTTTCEATIRSKRGVQTCRVGDFRYEDCNPCTCTEDQFGNTSWSCARMFCLPRRRRDVNVGSDFKDTPCAPNDFFQLPNCITCYCNSAKTGYLCSDSVCSDENNSTERSNKIIPQSNSLNLVNNGVPKSSTETPQEINRSPNDDEVLVAKSSTGTPNELHDTVKTDAVEESSPNSVEN